MHRCIVAALLALVAYFPSLTPVALFPPWRRSCALPCLGTGCMSARLKFVIFFFCEKETKSYKRCFALYSNLNCILDVKNAFTIVSPKRLWLCQAYSWDQKLQWISVLESSITAALEKS